MFNHKVLKGYHEGSQRTFSTASNLFNCVSANYIIISLKLILRLTAMVKGVVDVILILLYAVSIMISNINIPIFRSSNTERKMSAVVRYSGCFPQ